MNKIVFRSLMVGTGALAAALVMISVMVPLLGEPFQPSMFICAVVGSYSIGSSVTWYVLNQNERLKAVNGELEAAREQLEQLNAVLRHKVDFDPMTGMLNREAFLDRIRNRERRTDAGTLLIVDADHFKSINDQYGHLSGDEALRAISAAMHQSVRERDMLGRLGGEEFAVLLEGANAVEAHAVAERIRANVEDIRFEPRAGVMHPLTVSIGGTRWVEGASLAETMRRADLHLYAAKDAGRNTVVFAEAA